MLLTAVFPAVESDPVALAALTSAVSTLNAAMALRQLASTAATDIELADVESDLDAAVAGVQAELDALELAGATDAEVASAVAAVNAVLAAHAANTANPHVVTKAQVGLGSADNTADSAKPVSSAQQAAFDADRARLTSVESGRRKYTTLKQEGAVLDGVTDDSPAFAAAVTKATTQNLDLILDGPMRLNSRLFLGPTSGLRLRGVDPGVASIIQGYTGAGELLIDLGGYSASTTNPQLLTSDAVKGSRTLVVADAASYANGDRLILTSTDPWPESDKGATRGEIVRVASKAGNTLTLRWPLDDNYTTALAGSAKKLNTSSDFLLEGITFVNPAPLTHTCGMIRLRGFVDPVIRDVVFRQADRFMLMLEACDGFTVDYPRFIDAADDAAAGRLGYGVLAYGPSRNGLVTGAYMRGGRHAFTTGSGSDSEGIPRHIHVAHGHATAMTNACWDIHAEGEFVTFNDLHADNTLAFGVQMRAPNCDASNCTVDENIGPAFYVRAGNQTLRNCTSRRPRTGTVAGVGFDGQNLRIGDGPTIVGARDVLTVGFVGEDPDSDCVYVAASSDRSVHITPTLRRPGRGLLFDGTLSPNAMRFSGTSQDHQIISPVIANAGVGFAGPATVTNVRVDGELLRTVPIRSGGGIILGTNIVDPLRQLTLAGRWVRTPGAVSGSQATVNSRAYYLPVWVPGGSYDRIEVQLGGTAGTAGTVGRLGLYNDDSTGQPGTLLAEYGTVTLDASTNTEKPLTIALTVGYPGALLWTCVAVQGATVTTPTMLAASAPAGRMLLGHQPTLTSTAYIGFFQDSVTGALPSPAVPATTPLAAIPLVGLRRV